MGIVLGFHLHTRWRAGLTIGGESWAMEVEHAATCGCGIAIQIHLEFGLGRESSARIGHTRIRIGKSLPCDTVHGANGFRDQTLPLKGVGRTGTGDMLR